MLFPARDKFLKNFGWKWPILAVQQEVCYMFLRSCYLKGGMFLFLSFKYSKGGMLQKTIESLIRKEVCYQFNT